jgi:transposase InsO family protein
MKLTGINQLWVADITYIRLKAEFVYLAVILDTFSCKVVGWALDRTLAVRLPIAALEHAIAEREPLPGLVHHSDRGVQYASGDYVKTLRKHEMIPSMSRPANPNDNASCESFIKTLKSRRNLCQRRSGSGSPASEHRGIHRSVLQSVSPPLCTRLPAAGGVRTNIGLRHHCRRSHHEEIYRSDTLSRLTEADPSRLPS